MLLKISFQLFFSNSTHKIYHELLAPKRRKKKHRFANNKNPNNKHKHWFIPCNDKCKHFSICSSERIFVGCSRIRGILTIFIAPKAHIVYHVFAFAWYERNEENYEAPWSLGKWLKRVDSNKRDNKENTAYKSLIILMRKFSTRFAHLREFEDSHDLARISTPE